MFNPSIIREIQIKTTASGSSIGMLTAQGQKQFLHRCIINLNEPPIMDPNSIPTLMPRIPIPVLMYPYPSRHKVRYYLGMDHCHSACRPPVTHSSFPAPIQWKPHHSSENSPQHSGYTVIPSPTDSPITVLYITQSKGSLLSPIMCYHTSLTTETGITQPGPSPQLCSHKDLTPLLLKCIQHSLKKPPPFQPSWVSLHDSVSYLSHAHTQLRSRALPVTSDVIPSASCYVAHTSS